MASKQSIRLPLLALFTLFLWAFILGCGEPLTVRALYGVGGKGDHAWNDEAYRGLLETRAQFLIQLVEATPASVDEAASIFFKWRDAPHATAREMIFSVSGSYEKFIEEADCDFRNRHVIHLDSPLAPCEHAASVEFRTFASSFVAGALATNFSTTKKLSVIGGMAIPPVQEFAEGFAAGVRHAGGTVRVQYVPPALNGFYNNRELFERAKVEFSDWGADIVFPVAGGAVMGAINAANTSDKYYVIGVDCDQSSLGPNVVIGSVIKDIAKVTQRLVSQAATGDFPSGHYTIGLGDNASHFIINPQFHRFLQQPSSELINLALEAEKTYVQK